MISVFDIAKSEIEKFDWQKIMNVSNSLSDFNNSQWRFIKAHIIELCVEKYSNNNLQYVAEVHKDYHWPKLNISVELKSMTSSTMYVKKRNLRKKYSILLNNSMGTNKKTTLDKSDISDIIMVVFSDGVFIVDKETVLKNIHSKGDGFSLVLRRDQIVVIQKIPLSKKEKSLLSLKQEITNLIRNKI